MLFCGKKWLFLLSTFRSIRMALIYMISGIGGNLVCVIFDPNTPQVGA